MTPWAVQTYSHGELAVVVDCRDLAKMADFWCAVLGYRAVGGAEPYMSLLPDDGRDGPEVLLQRVPEGKVGKNRLHLDLRTRLLDDEVARLLHLGAERITPLPINEGGWTWRILADPEGNEFCVLQPPSDHWADLE